MRIVIYLLGILLMLFGVSNNISAQVSNDNEDGVYQIPSYNAKDFVPGQVLVKFKDANRIQIRRAAGKVSSTSSSPLTEMLQKYGDVEMEQLLPNENPNRQMRRSKAYNGETIQEHDLSQLYLINIKEGDAQGTMQMVNDLQALDEVEYAEPNYKVYIMAEESIAADYSSNPMVSQQWYLDAYGVKELWNKPIINKTRPVIAIIDTGVDITHPDLKDNIWTNMGEVDGNADRDNDYNGFKNDVHGWDFINNTPKMRDNNKHGTHVAGIAAAANNGIGIIGANPQALIMPITVMQSDGSGDVATIVKGVDYAVKNGATVINMSIGTYANSSALRQALEKAYQTAVLVAAAGNDGLCIYSSHYPKKHSAAPSFPAAYSFVLGVQATTTGGGLAGFSNYDCDGQLTSCEATAQDPDGFNYELKAPGTNILSTIPGGGYQDLQGTSMASPLVAGAISALQMVKLYDNQEILWGDLLHTNNIAEAYNVATRPAELDVMRVALRDRNESIEYDENGNSLEYYVVNVGETLNLYPILRSSFGKATNIKLKILVPSGVEVVTGEADFGYNLDAFGKAVSQNPLVIKVPDEMPNAATITVIVQVTCDESTETFSNSLELRVSNMYTLKGLIKENMTLTPNHVYYVIKTVGVDTGMTLTIEPGTRIEFASGQGLTRHNGKIIAKGTPEKPIIFTPQDYKKGWDGNLWVDTLSYCRVTGGAANGIVCHDCIFKGPSFPYGERNVITDEGIDIDPLFFYSNRLIRHTNIVNCGMNNPLSIYNSTTFFTPNFINTFGIDRSNKKYALSAVSSNNITTIKLDSLPYFGTAREDFVRPIINEYGNNADAWWGDTYATLDLSNMPKQPYMDAHGIVWKVLVNGKDAQDEQEELLPLGVEKHKLEVHFNRPMNKTVIPQISFGVLSPYNQHPVAEDASWNADGTIYTAYFTIDGKTRSDGMNRIYVRGAEDNEFFPCPDEASRFNIMVQAAGSMASGFQAEAGLGCVNLTWNNENNDFEDAMGFNVYRYTQSENGVNDTIRINENILDITATSYIDDSVTPGQTYYYYYKVLSTALQEYDVSNVVAATPLTATRGDANGSGNVDVADVVTTVNYITGLQPKPFVFDAADMNSDKLIDIFDVVGIIRGILNPSLLTSSLSEETATYTLEDGTLYVETPVALGGVQVQLTVDDLSKQDDISVASDLDGFETASSWLSDNDYLFLAYSMSGKTLSPGKHALLHIGDAEVVSIRLSDAQGKNVNVDHNGTTSIDRMGKHVMNVNGVYDLQGRKLSPASPLKKGIYIINGSKVVR